VRLTVAWADAVAAWLRLFTAVAVTVSVWRSPALPRNSPVNEHV
jgi:hypothetical protein